MLDRKTTTGAKTTASHDNSMSILQSTTPMLRYRHIMVQKFDNTWARRKGFRTQYVLFKHKIIIPLIISEIR